VCARWAQQQASQEKQAGNGRRSNNCVKSDRGVHVTQYSAKIPRRKPARRDFASNLRFGGKKRIFTSNL